MTGLLVALGAAVGAPLRYLAGHWLDRRLHWGTLLVNLVGSAMLGALVGAAVEGHWLALLGTGFCGGLTTYSAFAVQTVQGGRRRGSAYAVMTVTGCLPSGPGAPARHGADLAWASWRELPAAQHPAGSGDAGDPDRAARPTRRHPLDVLVIDGRVVEVGENLPRPPRANEHDADGRWLIPGLWDQHVHLDQWTQVSQRLDLTGTRSVEEVLDRVVARLAEGPGRAAAGLGASLRLVDPAAHRQRARRGHRRSHGDPDQRGRSQRLAEQPADAGLRLSARDTVVSEQEWFQAYIHLARLVGEQGTSPDAYLQTEGRSRGRASPDWWTSSSTRR